MKKISLLLFGLLFYINGFAQDFEVKYASVDIYISDKGYFDVVENYDVDFQDYKHGVFRNIQTKYDLLTEDGNHEKRRIKIRNVKVPGHKFQSDPDFVQKISDELEIKIGDKDVTVIGPQHYEIRYRVYDAFLFEKKYIRFYWNIKSSGWLSVFHKIDFTIHPPKNVEVGLADFFVYSGRARTTEESKEFEITLGDGVFIGKSYSDFQSLPGEDVTVLLNLPLNSVEEIKPLWPFWTNYGWTLIIGALLFGFYWIWNRFGKDDRVVATISYFPPGGMDPAMAGFLIDDKSDTRDLISLIPSWGSRGIIKMEEIPKSGWFGKDDSKLTMLKPLPDGAPTYEQEIFNGLFGSTPEPGEEVLVSSLKDSFYTTMNSAKTDLKTKAQIYYDSKAKKIQTQTIVGIIVLGILLFLVFLFTWGLLQALALIPVTIFLLIMTPHLVKKNPKGNDALSELKGFRQFIKVAEENKLKML
ncbi:MAG TPA: DUF2207 domain-containing protein, partial [Aequorivita sp.]|nr:DUF2207 domain-containing protein [Aequorivita sp.]